MKINDIKIGQKVEDYYCEEIHKGKIVKKLKTVVYIQFNGLVVKYDKAHLQFLRKIKEYRK